MLSLDINLSVLNLFFSSAWHGWTRQARIQETKDPFGQDDAPKNKSPLNFIYLRLSAVAALNRLRELMIWDYRREQSLCGGIISVRKRRNYTCLSSRTQKDNFREHGKAL
jgi:hypothetical protein